MKTARTLISLSILAALGLAAGAASAHEDVAQVISATPVMQRVAVPTRQCWNEQVAAVEERRVRVPGQVEYSEPRANTGGGAVLGAILGGVIGHQFGNSSGGRDHGAVAGAVLGGLVGNDIEKNNNAGGYRTQDTVAVERVPVTRNVQRCQTNTEYRDQVIGYDVRYRYGGREYLTRMDRNPGPTLAVTVEVRPGYAQGY